jgi:PilZ domain
LSAIPRQELSRRLRRQFARFQFEVNAEVVCDSNKEWGRITDISRTGLFIEMIEPPAVGAEFVAYLALNLPLKLHCSVRRVVPGRGVGVAVTVPMQSKKRFEALLQALLAGADPATTAAKIPQPQPPPIAKVTRAVAAAAAAAGKR